MTTPTLINMIFILAFVIGGFIFLLSLALRKEKQKTSK